MYFLKPVSDEVRSFQTKFQKDKQTMKLVLIAILSCLAAILQAFGGFLPGAGFFISPLATAPVLLGAMISIPYGLMSYLLTCLLLFILEPTELIIFPFTTGLLGVGIGTAFHLFRRRISIIAAGSILLAAGILSLLFILGFPILGPLASDSFSLLTASLIVSFSILYSWLWVEMALVIFKRVRMIMH